MNLSAVVTEANLVGNPREWWVETGATRHICADNKIFSMYQKVDGGDHLTMGNSSTFQVVGQGTLVLKMTFRTKLTLKNILHVPDTRKNLVSGSLRSKNSFKLVFIFALFYTLRLIGIPVLNLVIGFLACQTIAVFALSVISLYSNKNLKASEQPLTANNTI